MDFYLNVYNPKHHAELWSKRCKDCSMCCYSHSMAGRCHDKEKFPKAKKWWNLDFVIIEFVDSKICPLATADGCLIQDDKPLLCKLFFCVKEMKYDGL